MENQSSRRRTVGDGIRRSPRLSRTASTTMPEIPLFKLNSGRKSVDKPNSTARTRINSSSIKAGEENRNPSPATRIPIPIPGIIKRPQSENLILSNPVRNLQRQRSPDIVTIIPIPGIIKKPQSENLIINIPVRNLQRQQSPDVVKNIEKVKPKRTGSVSPSAWALSPGRSSSIFSVPESPDSSGRTTKQSSKSVNSVLNYFRQKKASSIQEELLHQLRIMHTRLLQWRFANARAESTLAANKHFAEDKIFKVWLRIFHLRNSILEKRLHIEKLKHEIKIIQIIDPQVCIINEWEKIEKKNSEAVARIGRKLSASSTALPLINGAKADSDSVQNAMFTAMSVMESIEATIMKFISQVEEAASLASELVNTVEQERKELQELRKEIAIVASLEAKEESLKAHTIQAATQRIVEGNHLLSSIKLTDAWHENVKDKSIHQQRYRKGHFLRLYLSNVHHKDNLGHQS
ncbi:QWRF motif-containing protein 7-like [Telopea speciosissima]|uniref:QWRF motif-containing protein 7-like n=1 Tax=Telopea speciosissima TaxID=54955 RepID=UPI001CC40C58|nr:QWRF motif-containing protein 7-like [Telopea speciosissima]